MRWLVAVVVTGLVIAGGYVLLLNPERVTLHLTPDRSVTPPLAGALLVAFAAGGCLAAFVAGIGAGRRGWRSWRARRRVRHEERRASSTTRARDLVWAGDYARARAELLQSGDDLSVDAARIVLLAETHLHEGDPAAARRVVEEGLHEVGLEPRLLDVLGEAAERAGDLRAAADALERARVAQPESPRLTRPTLRILEETTR